KAVQLWANGPYFAEYNIGATSATENGGYYTWGGTYENGDGKDWSDDHNTTNTGSEDLTSTEDTATKLWGSKWRMPTKEELAALLNQENCICTWTENYKGTGVKGLLCQGKEGTAFAFNSVFLPAAGHCIIGVVHSRGSSGYYWSSSPYGSDLAYRLYFGSGSQYVGSDSSSLKGCSVRAVLAE
ncbi:MAG: hypothetical protein MJY74_08560, partial [Bacteroidaceae bacterium]|nr:hypothetical protein [Bacteroidaceae bacterium]